jgi:hypothetical protein
MVIVSELTHKISANAALVMGGFGSGGHNSTGAATCESCHSIDLAWLRRRGMLMPGRHSTLTWSQAGEQTGSITLAAQHDGVRLIYQIKDRDGPPINVDEFVAFSYTPTDSADAGSGCGA